MKKSSPYDYTLYGLSSWDVKRWSEKVLAQLRKVADLENDEFVFLAIDKYKKYLIPKIKNYKIPLEGLNRGRQLHFLKEMVG